MRHQPQASVELSRVNRSNLVALDSARRPQIVTVGVKGHASRRPYAGRHSKGSENKMDARRSKQKRTPTGQTSTDDSQLDVSNLDTDTLRSIVTQQALAIKHLARTQCEDAAADDAGEKFPTNFSEGYVICSRPWGSWGVGAEHPPGAQRRARGAG